MRTTVITLGMTLLAASALATEQVTTYPTTDTGAYPAPVVPAGEPLSVASRPIAYPLPSYAALTTPPPVEEAEETPSITMDEVRDEIKKLNWTKGEMKIVPYGALWGSLIYNTERNNPGPYTLWIFSRDTEGEEAFTLDARRTRLGVDITGPVVPLFDCAASGGKVEIDFHGTFVEENKPSVLLRHAYGEIKNEDFRLLAGQTWDVISPLYPGVLSYSVLWDQGNVGYRRTQLRFERYYDVCVDHLLTVQGSANQNIVSDFLTTAGVERESTGWPVFEGRVAWTNKSPCWVEGPVTLGFSGHIGEQGFDFTTDGPGDLLAEDDVRIQTWSSNVDLYVPITKCTGIQGEFFSGSNLATFFGGIGQGVSLYTREGIRAHGGWIDIWHDWASCLHSHAGFGIDDPNNDDVVSGRGYNRVIFTNVIYDITSFLVVGTEISLAKTTYVETRDGLATPRPGESVGMEFTCQYKF